MLFRSLLLFLLPIGLFAQGSQAWFKYVPENDKASFFSSEYQRLINHQFLKNEVHACYAIYHSENAIDQRFLHQVYNYQGDLLYDEYLPNDSAHVASQYFSKVVWDENGDYIIHYQNEPNLHFAHYTKDHQLKWRYYESRPFAPWMFSNFNLLSENSFTSGNLLLKVDADNYAYLDIHSGEIERQWSLNALRDSLNRFVPVDSVESISRSHGDQQHEVLNFLYYRQGETESVFLKYDLQENRFTAMNQTRRSNLSVIGGNHKNEFRHYSIENLGLKEDGHLNLNIQEYNFEGLILRNFNIVVKGYFRSSDSSYLIPTLHFQDFENQNLLISYSIQRKTSYTHSEIGHSTGFQLCLFDKNNQLIYRSNHWPHDIYTGTLNSYYLNHPIHLFEDNSALGFFKYSDPGWSSGQMMFGTDENGKSPFAEANYANLNLEIFPNPARDFIKLSPIKSGIHYSMDIFNQNGERVFSHQTKYYPRAQLYINLEPGLYIARLIQEDRVYRGKLQVVE